MGAPVALGTEVHLPATDLTRLGNALSEPVERHLGAREVPDPGDGPDRSRVTRRWEGNPPAGPVQVVLDLPPDADAERPLRLRIRMRRRDGELFPILGVGMLAVSAVAGSVAILLLGADPVPVTAVSGLNAFAGTVVYTVGLLRLRRWVDAATGKIRTVAEEARRLSSPASDRRSPG